MVMLPMLTLMVVWRAVIGPALDPNSLRLPAARQVETRLPKLGVHTRLTDEVEQSKIQRTLEMVNDMGAAWDVEYFPWNYVQPKDPGQWDWAHADLVVNHAQAQGLRLIARLDGVPEWARPPLTAHSLLLPEQQASFAAYAAAFAARYRGKVTAYVVWNEPNVDYEWGDRAPDPAAYAALLKAVQPAIKQADPNALVLTAALAPTTEKSAAAMDDLDFLQGLYEAGAGPFFDGLAAHAYGWQRPPEDVPDAATVNFRRVELERQIMVANGDSAKDVYITESGWNDYARWIRAVGPRDRVDFTLRAVQLASDWDWLAAICVWDFRLPAPAHTFNDGWSLVNFDFTPTPTYVALQRLATPNPPAHWQPFIVPVTRPNPVAALLANFGEKMDAFEQSAWTWIKCAGRDCKIPPDLSLLQVQQAGMLRVAVDASFPPFEAVGQSGQIEGTDVDLANRLATTLGVRLELVNVSSDGLKDAIVSGKADAIVSSFQAIPEWRKELMYSPPYVTDIVPVTSGLDAAGEPLVQMDSVQYVVAVRAGRNKLLAAIDAALT
ncbi:MAG: transporter substrate-binding domain-containing protein [Chloroflexi bacterium]|nr:transporter substrate-binding domain-containing protein [Chloroflexota bacterium]